MEDLKIYIESGILELYVLGELSPEERVQVEEMALKHPAVKAELDAIGQAMEAYAKENSVEPSEGTRDKVLNSLLTNFGDDHNFPSRKQREPVANNVIPLAQAKPNNFYKYAFAACLALLLVSVVALVNINNKLSDSNTQLTALQAQNEHFSNRVNLMDHDLAIYRDPTYKLLKLKGTPKSPSSVLTIAFSSAKKKVMIDMADANIPANDKDHQYQLWALVGGKPVDLGVFDADTTSKELKQMKEIASADAFAVTLEKRGGSPTPTMNEMMVLGKF